jgi:hypothetical protein
MRRSLAVASLSLLAVAAVAGLWLAKDASAADEVQIASLLNDLESMNSQELEALAPLSIRRFAIPDDSVDVMRAKISETYSVDGVGQDTVELAGWVAVKHFNARPVDGSNELTWANGVVDTEFVGLDMTGHSKLFGPVQVRIDSSRPVQGQVGRIQIPEYAEVALLAELQTDAARVDTPKRVFTDQRGQARLGQETQTKALRGGETEAQEGATEMTDSIETGACVAEVNVIITMPELNLEMATSHPVHWYSLVETIPPVGHTASIAVEPVRLVSNGREVATLVSGKVNFREVVRRVMLTSSDDSRVAP